MANLAGTVSAQGREKHGYNSKTSTSWTQHRGKKTKSELEVLAQRYGWKQRPDLTLADIHVMTPDEIQWRETFDKENLANGFNSNVRKAEAEKKHLEDFWNTDQLSDADWAAIQAAGKSFTSQFPQYIEYPANGAALEKYCNKHRLNVRKPESFITAFQELAKDGAIVVSPAAIWKGEPKELLGEELKNYIKTTPELLQPLHDIKQQAKIAEQKRQNSLTSDQWKAETKHAWLDVDGVPNLKKLDDNTRGAVLGQMGHLYAEFAAQEPRWTDTKTNREALLAYLTANHFNYSVPELNRAFREMMAKGLVTPATPVFDKAAFQREIAGMSSVEYDRRYKDPVFRMKADSL